MVASDRRKWLALALLSVVQFMVVLDIAIVNVALPSIQVDLGFSEQNLQWVISAYVLVFGGLSSFVYAITKAGQDGWLAGTTLSFFATALALLVGFVVWEQRHPEPLMRLGVLRIKTVTGANVAGFILGTATFSMFLM